MINGWTWHDKAQAWGFDQDGVTVICRTDHNHPPQYPVSAFEVTNHRKLGRRGPSVGPEDAEIMGRQLGRHTYLDSKNWADVPAGDAQNWPSGPGGGHEIPLPPTGTSFAAADPASADLAAVADAARAYVNPETYVNHAGYALAAADREVLEFHGVTIPASGELRITRNAGHTPEEDTIDAIEVFPPGCPDDRGCNYHFAADWPAQCKARGVECVCPAFFDEDGYHVVSINPTCEAHKVPLRETT
jgi:hypothetical protein